MTRFATLALTHALIALPLSALAAPLQAPQIAVTHHKTNVGGGSVTYTATVGETFVAGPDGQASASLVTLAYVRDDAPDRAKRPVMFVFNGGPGASSSPLNFSAFGPERFTDKDGQRSLADNPYSLIDAVDLVFVDPIGTGVSRPFPGADGQPYWSVTGDAVSVKAVIAKWLHDNGREASPRYICGESYGTVRAGQIAKIGGDLNLDGILLFSLVAGGGGADINFTASFPTMADAAAFHGKSALAGKPVRQVYDEAADFARTQLLPDLVQGEDLPAGEKQKMATRMSRYIGLPADYIASKNLRIEKYDFMEGVLKAEGQRTGQLDTRARGELAVYKPKKPPADDPSMSMGSSKGASYGPTSGELIDAYLSRELGFTTAEKYKTLDLQINSKWKYDAPGGDGQRLGDPAGNIGAAMKLNPKLRLFWVGGLYDLTTPVFAARYALNHAGIPTDRLTAVEFPTGHSVFETETSLAEFTSAVRKFVTAAK